MLLDEKHQKVAIEIIQKHRTKKHCNKCYDRGYIGFTPEKTIVPCEKCVDIEKAMEEWKQYVSGDNALKEDFKELFEDDVTTEETVETEHKVEEHKEEKHSVKEIAEKKVKVKKETTTPTTPKNKTATQKAAVPRKSGRRSS